MSQILFGEIWSLCSLSLVEQIEIIAAYHAMSAPPEIDYKARGYSEAQIAAIKKNERFVPITSLGFTFRKKPSLLKMHSAEFDYLSMLFLQYRDHGTLPFPGSISNQPAQIFDAFNLLKSLIQEAEQKEQKKRKNKK